MTVDSVEVRWILILLVGYLTIISADQGLRICIVGGGASGSSLAVFLRQEIARARLDYENIRIDLYEGTKRLGGRIQSTSFSTGDSHHHFELGASIFHGSNYYMKTFAKFLNISIGRPARSNSLLGIFDGKDFLFKTSMSSIVTILTMVWRYGLMDYWRLQSDIQEIASRFADFYHLQHSKDLEHFLWDQEAYVENSRTSAKATFGTIYVETFLASVGLYELTQQSIEDYLVDHTGLSRKSLLLQELIAAAVRVNYNQPLTINALAGAIGIIPMTQPDLFEVKEGNEKIPQKLIDKFVDNVYLGHNVRVIAKAADGIISIEGSARHAPESCVNHEEIKQLSCSNDADNLGEFFSRQYDIIVIAAPLETSSISFEGFDHGEDAQAVFPTRNYRHTHTTFIEGRFRERYFKLNSLATPLPGSTLTVDPSKRDLSCSNCSPPPFTSIGSYYQFPDNITTIYKVFSQQELNDSTVDMMFARVRSIRRKDWQAYPVFSPPEKFASFRPYKGVYYINAFENAMSCMEGMAVAAKNVAIVMGQDLKDRLAQNALKKTVTGSQAGGA